jgi:nucleoside-diphosphate-sugar epimerase
MNIFLTGATGLLGSSIGRALAAAGHHVHALVRSPATILGTTGWTAVPGDLGDLALLTAAAARADGVVHAARAADDASGAADTAATRALLAGLAGTGRPLLYTSGTWVLGTTGDAWADESSPTHPTAPLVGWRSALEREVLAAGAHGVRASVIRPGIVFGDGAGILGALGRGELPVVGSGRQRWSLVHRDDLAELYVKALAAPAGSVLHGVGTVATVDEIVATLGAAAPPLRRLPLDAARRELGAFADALALDQQVDARQTRARLGWQPHRSLALALRAEPATREVA